MALKQKGSVDLLANAFSWLFLHEKPPDAVRKTLQKMARIKVYTILKAFLDDPRLKPPANFISIAATRCPFPYHALQCHQTTTRFSCRCYNREPQCLPTTRKRHRHSLRPNSRATPRLPWKHTLPLPPARRIAHHLPYNGTRQLCAARPRGQSPAPSRPPPPPVTPGPHSPGSGRRGKVANRV